MSGFFFPTLIFRFTSPRGKQVSVIETQLKLGGSITCLRSRNSKHATKNMTKNHSLNLLIYQHCDISSNTAAHPPDGYKCCDIKLATSRKKNKQKRNLKRKEAYLIFLHNKIFCLWKNIRADDFHQRQLRQGRERSLNYPSRPAMQWK